MNRVNFEKEMIILLVGTWITLCSFSVFSPPLFRRYLLDKLVIHSTGIFSAAILSFKPTGQAKKSGRCGVGHFGDGGSRSTIKAQVFVVVYITLIYIRLRDLNHRVWRNQERNDHQRIPPPPTFNLRPSDSLPFDDLRLIAIQRGNSHTHWTQLPTHHSPRFSRDKRPALSASMGDSSLFTSSDELPAIPCITQSLGGGY